LTHITDPFSINYTFINGLATPLRDLPYKDKFLLALKLPMGPVGFAATYGTSLLGGVTFESGSGDYAEWLERSNPEEKIGIGDVVAVVGGKITKNTKGASQFMVASVKPCVLGNMPEVGREEYFNKVAFMGQIPVKMLSPVKQGDYIIPDGENNGFAKAISPSSITADNFGQVLGVAWEDAPNYGFKFVNVAVGLKPQEMVSVLQDHSKRIENLEMKSLEIDQLASEFNEIKSNMNSTSSAIKYSKKNKQSRLVVAK
jgi:hypothetical protein